MVGQSGSRSALERRPSALPRSRVSSTGPGERSLLLLCETERRAAAPGFVEKQHSEPALLLVVQRCATNVEGGWM